MNMRLDEISKCCDWERFCDLSGTNLYAINEGGGHIDVNLTLEEAEKYGILKIKKW